MEKIKYEACFGSRFSVLAIILLLLLPAGCASMRSRSQEARIENQWGIKIVAIRLTEAGFMVDLRYKVLDAEKAKPILRLSDRAYLIDQKTGIKVDVPSMPKAGSLRSTSRVPLVGKQYFILFGNNLKFINPGDRVTVVIGDLRIENLVVE